MAARDLLTDSGSCFVQIGDENVHVVRSLMDEIFGPDNFVSQITFVKTSSSTSQFGGTADSLLWYARNRITLKFRPLYLTKATGGAGGSGYTRVELANGDRRPLTKAEITDNALLPQGSRIFASDNLTSQSAGREKG
jgi:adenine-specific DNA-methyltransferase